MGVLNKTVYFLSCMFPFLGEAYQFYPAIFRVIISLHESSSRQSINNLRYAAFGYVHLLSKTFDRGVSFSPKKHQTFKFRLGQVEFFGLKYHSVLTTLMNFAKQTSQSLRLVRK